MNFHVSGLKWKASHRGPEKSQTRHLNCEKHQRRMLPRSVFTFSERETSEYPEAIIYIPIELPIGQGEASRARKHYKYGAKS